MTDVLNEAKRLHALGFAILWIRPKAKNPVKSGWTTGPRETWEELKKSYKEGYNVGVRTGTVSRIQDLYLACIDVDVKDPAFREEALTKYHELVGKSHCWEVTSGGGNGSLHGYCLTSQPFKMLTVAKEKGWEICIYSDGRQMVLPPSIHPSGRKYQWKKHDQELPLLDFSAYAKEKVSCTDSKNDCRQDFVIDETLDVRWLPDLSDEIRDAIVSGAGVTDRSGYMLKACNALHSAGLGRDSILTIMTDQSLYLGKTAYEHAKTNSRRRAAQWVWNYTLQRVMKERDPKAAFNGDTEIERGELEKWEAELQKEEIKNERSWKQDLQVTEKGKVVHTLPNLFLIMKNEFGPRLFRFNEFSKRDEVWEKLPWGGAIGDEFQERDIQKFKLWLAQRYHLKVVDAELWAVLINIADENKYHPIKEYLESLPPWDTVPRLDFFLEKYLRGEAPLKYMRTVSRKTIVAMVARVFQPGIKFDNMLILEGEQGLRKSTAIEILAGKSWFSDVNLNLKHKDCIADMEGKWVLEQGEMQVMRAYEVAELKQFLSRNTDRMRPSYGRKSQDYPRQSIFIGTTNENIYLKDTTGSRRFWPIKMTGECDVEAIKRDRDQIFAEALMKYKEGEQIWIADAETNHLAKLQQEERETDDALIDVLDEWIEKQIKNPNFEGEIFDPENIKMGDLFFKNGPFASTRDFPLKMDMESQKRVGECLRKLGYVRRVAKEKRKSVKIWVKLPLE